MDPAATRRIGRKDQQVWVEEEEGGVSGVERLKGYYDEARSKLKNYLGREDGEFVLCWLMANGLLADDDDDCLCFVCVCVCVCVFWFVCCMLCYVCVCMYRW